MDEIKKVYLIKHYLGLDPKVLRKEDWKKMFDLFGELYGEKEFADLWQKRKEESWNTFAESLVTSTAPEDLIGTGLKDYLWELVRFLEEEYSYQVNTLYVGSKEDILLYRCSLTEAVELNNSEKTIDVLDQIATYLFESKITILISEYHGLIDLMLEPESEELINTRVPVAFEVLEKLEKCLVDRGDRINGIRHSLSVLEGMIERAGSYERVDLTDLEHSVMGLMVTADSSVRWSHETLTYRNLLSKPESCALNQIMMVAFFVAKDVEAYLNGEQAYHEIENGRPKNDTSFLFEKPINSEVKLSDAF